MLDAKVDFYMDIIRREFKATGNASNKLDRLLNSKTVTWESLRRQGTRRNRNGGRTSYVPRESRYPNGSL